MSENTQDMQIFGIIEQLEGTVENSPKPKLGGGNKRIVDVDEIYDLLGDLKVTIPEDIRRANSVIVEAQNVTDNADDYARDVVEKAQNEADHLVADAEERANQIMLRAKEEYERLISEDEVYKEAQRRAQLLAAKAEYNANSVYENAKVYADEVLVDLQRFLREYEQLVDNNRRDLGARAQQPQPTEQPVTPAQAENKANARAEREEHAIPRPEHRRPARVQRQEEPIEEPEDDDDFEEEEERGFLGLFKRRKRVEDDDFIDDDM